MNRKEALKHCGNLETYYLDETYELSGYLMKMLAEIDNLEAQLKSKDELLMEAYESVIDHGYRNAEYPNGRKYSRCVGCYEEFGHKHKDNCIVNKAQDYISKES